MNDDLFAGLHAATAGELDDLLDVEAGLREALVPAQHTRTGQDLDLDVEAGLGAIVPAPEAVTRSGHPDVAAGMSEVRSAAAAKLMSLSGPDRLALRNHRAVIALALVLEVTTAAAAGHRLVDYLAYDITLTFARTRDPAFSRALDVAGNLARDAARDLDMVRARAARGLDAVRARAVVRDLDRDLARDLGVALDRARTHAPDLDRERVRDLDRALARARGLAHDLAGDHEPAADRDLGADLHRALARDQERARGAGRARRIARDLDHARNDFTEADLSGANLTGVPLGKVRWSMATTWPSDDWKAQALLDSRDLGDGTYEIQGGNTRVSARGAG